MTTERVGGTMAGDLVSEVNQEGSQTRLGTLTTERCGGNSWGSSAKLRVNQRNDRLRADRVVGVTSGGGGQTG